MRTFRHVTSAALTALVLFASAAPATADPSDATADPAPPSRMSAVGGPLLGKPGTQVRPATGTPALPAKLTARSWIVADADSGEVLAAHNAHWRLAPASTLKMLFADTLLPRFDKGTKHRVSLAELSGVQPGSSLVGVKENQTYTVHDLWLGVFLRSGNDAVHVLCAMNGGVDTTVRQMQEQAEELQANDTRVVTPDGFDAPGQVSSAYDLTLFARHGLRNPDFRGYSSTQRARFPGLTGKNGRRETFEIQNTNRLLTGTYGLTRYPGLTGVKNGYTSHAGNTLTVAAERDGRTLLVTLMHPDSGGNTVYEESAKLLDWGFAAGDTVQPVGTLVPPKSEAVASAEPTGPDDQEPPGNRAGGSQSDLASGDDDPAGVPTTGLVLAAVAAVLLGGVVFLIRRRPLPGVPGPGGWARHQSGAGSAGRRQWFRRKPRLPRR